jgi:predicted DCC family thiol-disulfide oxidoreductase YuxK
MEQCLRQMHLVTPDGRIFGGMEAVVQALATRPVVRFLVYPYYLPGIRQTLDWLYRVIAANRYRILGKTGECHEGTCSLHFRVR